MAVASSAMLDNKHHRQQKEQQQQTDSTPEQQEQQAVESLPPTVTPESPPLRAYDPDRVFTPAQLETLNILSAPIWIFDYVERRMRWANNAALKMFSADSLEEFLVRDFSDISDASARRLDEVMLKAKSGLHSETQWTLYPKGKAVTVKIEFSGIRLSKDEDYPSFLNEGTLVDKEEITTENLRSVEMLRHLPMAVAQFDINGKVMFENPEAYLWKTENCDNHQDDSATVDREDASHAENSMQGSEQDQNDDHGSTTCPSSGPRSFRKRKADSLLHRFVDADIGKKVLEDILTEKRMSLEAMLHTREGPKWSAIEIRRSKDPVTGQSVILYNARDKSDALWAKREREARKQKSEFLAVMAHEIRTPLHQVTGFIDLLDQTSLDKEQKSFVKLLKSSSQGLMCVINDVLDYSKLEAGKMKLESIPYEPKMVLEGSLGAVRSSCEEKNISLDMEWSKDVPFRLIGDPNRLRQILLNLLSNAVKFTKHGGITVKTTFIKDGAGNDDHTKQSTNNESSKENPPSKKTSMVKYVVTDTGMGISDENMAVIFQKYQQANVTVARTFGGTGLGLSICQQLVQNMGGEIGVDSKFGSGSSFWFVLPAEIYSASDTPEIPEDDDGREISALNILIAEDNKVNQKLLANILKRLGHTSAVAENGKVAIEMVEKGEYDLVLMDIQMPVMDGLEATRRLRTMGYNDLPIYGLTASVSRSDFTELGFDDWLPKPIPMKELKAKLYQLRQRISLAAIPETQ